MKVGKSKKTIQSILTAQKQKRRSIFKQKTDIETPEDHWEKLTALKIDSEFPTNSAEGLISNGKWFDLPTKEKRKK